MAGLIDEEVCSMCLDLANECQEQEKQHLVMIILYIYNLIASIYYSFNSVHAGCMATYITNIDNN